MIQKYMIIPIILSSFFIFQADILPRDHASADISLEISPGAGKIIPDEKPVDLQLNIPERLHHDNSYIRLQIRLPETNPFFTTEYPVIEGKIFTDAHLSLSKIIHISQIFPIRGNYRMDVSILSHDSGSILHSKSFRIPVQENPRDRYNLAVLSAALFFLGFFSGIIFRRSQISHKKTSIMTVSSFLYPAAFFSFLFSSYPGEISSHEKKPVLNTGNSDFTQVHHAPFALTVKLIPSNSEKVLSLTEIKSHAAKHLFNENKEPQTGRPAYIAASFEKNQKGAPGIFSIKIIHKEKQKTVLYSEIVSSDGQMIWGHHFYDGGPYSVEISAKEKNSSHSMQTALHTDAASAEPPAESILKSLLLLIFITAAGIPAGYFLGPFLRIK